MGKSIKGTKPSPSQGSKIKTKGGRKPDEVRHLLEKNRTQSQKAHPAINRRRVKTRQTAGGKEKNSSRGERQATTGEERKHPPNDQVRKKQIR